MTVKKKRPLKFEIADKVRVDADYDKRVVYIVCKTKDGRSVRFEAGYQMLDAIHDEIQKHLGRE